MNSNQPAETILVVDDQEQNIRIVGTVLSLMGYEVVPATSAEQAQKRLAARLPDLILLDLLMPDVDGLELCRLIKAEPRTADVPIVFLSAADDKNLIVQALESGGVDYVTKPFNKAELLSRVRTQLALKKARDELRRLAEDKDELLGILAHDLKNHLAGMKISAALLAGRPDELSPRCATLAENISQSTDRVLAFVREFLANQSAERLVLKRGPIELGPLLHNVVREHQAAAGLKKISLTTEISEAAIIVDADPEALRQVADNLVSNAVKFCPVGGWIRVTAGLAPASYARFTVQDSGPGFAETDREKLFGRYGRLSARPTAGEPSTGLGLSIVKRIIDALRGRISLESAPGEGAHFAVLLPLVPMAVGSGDTVPA